MADEIELKPKGSCLGKLVTLVALCGVAGLAVALYFVVRAQDMSDIKRGASGRPARDLREVLKNSVDRGYPLTLSEEEINRYLKQTLLAKQGGVLGEAVTVDGVRVRLEEGRAEIVIERSVMGWPLTLSMFVRVEQTVGMKGATSTSILRDGGPFLPEVPRLAMLVKGGRFGQLVVPQGFLLLVLPSFDKLAKLYAAELELGFQEMSRISIIDGKLELDPRPDAGKGLPGERDVF
ncbi:MAG: hypothetical protein EAZ84_10235 [Verrucomicrobia bacterium]|nr:MAG: hypothetical protein EAZ84_10235 [Verrucomicrobiota bacterium]TAE86369.1 MAG: hypothetical protein EAZ82_11400 [Verrucomicrobiota bacterium]TAF24346.1 MAG: hypothetical protein EAZ71_10745 [Verrucomicrobiota bacterium]